MPIVDLPSPRNREIFWPQVAEARRFLLPTGLTQSAGIVTGGGYEVVDARYALHRRNFPFIVLELVVGGEGEGEIDGRPFALRPGTFFLYTPHTPHRLATSPHRPLHKYFLDLSPTTGRRALRRLKLPAAGAWAVRSWNDLARLYDEIIHHGTAASPMRQGVCDALLEALLLQLAQSANESRDASPAMESYQHCCHAIDTAAVRLRSLEDLSIEVQLDPAYICRLFKRFDHQTPYQRLLHKRMSLAASELYRGGASVKAVATRFGYGDPFHFSRAFKAAMGVPPSQLRKMTE